MNKTDNNEKNQLIKIKVKTPRKPKIYTVKTLSTDTHKFNVGIAIDYSPDMALWLGHLAFWTNVNFINKKNIHDGLAWCYDTLETLCKYFPYYTQRQLETVINNSVKEGLVKRGNYNKNSYDRTCWYALTPKAYFYFQYLLTDENLQNLFDTHPQICEIEISDFVNLFPRSVTPIPDTNSDTDPYIYLNTHSSGSDSEVMFNRTVKNGDPVEYYETDANLDDFPKVGLLEEPLQESGSPGRARTADMMINRDKGKKSTRCGLNELLDDNPFEIPEQLLKDWITVRKGKRAALTLTAWHDLNKELFICHKEGMDIIEVFTKMVANGWTNLKADWFTKSKNQSTGIKQWTVDEVMRA